MAAGESPKVAISSPAQYCGLRLRRGRIRELLEEHRTWCEPGRAGARDLPEAAEGEAGSARRGGEQKTLAAQGSARCAAAG